MHGRIDQRRRFLLAVASAAGAVGVTLAACSLTIPIDSLESGADAASSDASTTEGSGACATPCPTGYCRQGACVIADHLRKPRRGLAVDGASVYWTTLCGELMKHSLTGGVVEGLFTRDGASFGALALTSGGAAWADRSAREVLVLPLTGTPTILSVAPDAAAGTPVDLAVGRSGTLYGLAVNDVWSISFDAGAPSAALLRARTLGGADSLAVAEPYLAWSLNTRDGLDAGGVRAFQLDAATADALGTRDATSSADASDSADLSDAAEASSLPSPSDLADVATPSHAIATDGASAYFASEDGSISSVPLAGGAIRVVVRGEVGINGLAVDDGFVYWTTRGTGNDGRVRRAAKLGSADTNVATTYATGLAYPAEIVVTSSFVYWVEEGSPDDTACSSSAAAKGAVVRIAK